MDLKFVEQKRISLMYRKTGVIHPFILFIFERTDTLPEYRYTGIAFRNDDRYIMYISKQGECLKEIRIELDSYVNELCIHKGFKKIQGE